MKAAAIALQAYKVCGNDPGKALLVLVSASVMASEMIGREAGQIRDILDKVDRPIRDFMSVNPQIFGRSGVVS